MIETGKKVKKAATQPSLHKGSPSKERRRHDTPAEERPHNGSHGRRGIWLMCGAWGSGLLTMISLTAGSLCSGFVYGYDLSLPWFILSVVLFTLGLLFIVLVEEPEEAEV